MSRLAVLVIVLLLLIGGAYYLSTVPKQVPAKTIEVDVQQAGDAR